MPTVKIVPALTSMFGPGAELTPLNSSSALLAFLNNPDEPDFHKPRTQKGRGLFALRGTYDLGVDILYSAVIQTKNDFPASQQYPCFARPCPSQPKHGYIDSRMVKSQAEAEKLLDQVLADDPGGELLLCGFIPAAYNMLWTPGSLVIGPGHDGATAGKKTLTIPLAGGVPKDFGQKLLTRAGIEEWPYVEAVWPKDHNTGITLTQLRSGPRLDNTLGGDYIPALLEVQTIIKADPKKFKDRDWEKLIDSQAGQPGVVVWHPQGAMTDHFSIHAFTHQIPIIFGAEPKVGDILQPSGGGQVGFSPEAMLRGVLAGEKFPLFGGKNMVTSKYRFVTGPVVKAMLVALHNASAMTGEHSKWLGFGAAIMLRFGVTALRGEARHLRLTKAPMPGRETVYKASLHYSLRRQKGSISRLVNIFRYGEFESPSFGGLKWAECGAAVMELFNSIQELASNPGEASAARLVRALNISVNQAHNGGWWLNKFVEDEAFGAIQQSRIGDILGTSKVFYLGEKIYQSLSPKLLEVARKEWAAWAPLSPKPPRVSEVQISYSEESKEVGLKITTRLLKGKFRSLSAPVEMVVDNFEALIKDHTFLVETLDGFQLELRDPSKPTPRVIWKEASISESAQIRGQKE